MDENAKRLVAKITPEAVLLTLVHAGSFLSAYELIKYDVIEQVRSFYLTGFDEKGLICNDTGYQRSVLSLDPKSKFRASAAWLQSMDAITAEEVTKLEEIKNHRDEITHEMPGLLVEPDFVVKTQLLAEAAEIVRRLGIFWGTIAVQTDTIFDPDEVDYEGIKSGSYLLMEYLVGLAGGVAGVLSGEQAPAP
jgi:hypothetical protein